VDGALTQPLSEGEGIGDLWTQVYALAD
jgi:hypothetical protein